MNFFYQQPHHNITVIVLALFAWAGIGFFFAQQAFATDEPVPGLRVTIAPGPQTVVRGGTATFTYVLESVNGYDEQTRMTVNNCPQGATCLINGSPSPKTYPGFAGGTVTVTVQTTATTPSGTMALPLFIESLESSFQLNSTMTLTVQDFTLAIDPSSQDILQGQTVTYTTTVSGLQGYTGPVSLAATNVPSGASIAFPDGSSGTLSTEATSFTKSIMLTPQPDAIASNTYIFTIQATSGTLSQAFSATYTIQGINTPDFSLTLSPMSGAEGFAGEDIGPFQFTLQAENGFTGQVSMELTDLPPGWIIYRGFAVTYDLTDSDQGDTSNFAIRSSSSTAEGTYTLTLKATSGTTTHTVPFSLFLHPPIAQPDFSLLAQGASPGRGWNVTVTSFPADGVTGDVNLTVEWITYDPNVTVDIERGYCMGGVFDGRMEGCQSDQTCIDGNDGNVCQGLNGHFTFPIGDSLYGFFASADTSVGINQIGPSFPPGTTFLFRFKGSHATLGDRFFPADGSYLSVTFREQQDNGITLTTDNNRATVIQGDTATYSLTLRAATEYTGTSVNLTTSNCPANAACTFAEGGTTVINTSLAAGQTKALSYTIQTQVGSAKTPVGSYDTITMTGTDTTDPDIRSSSILRLQVDAPAQPDFSITSITPNPLTLDPNDTGSYTVTVGRTGGFTGDVKINWTAVPTP